MLIHKSEVNNDRVICRFGLNTAFLNREDNSNRLTLKLDKNYVCPNSIKKTKEYEHFKVKLQFSSACKDRNKECQDPASEFVCKYCKGILGCNYFEWKHIRNTLKQRIDKKINTREFGTKQLFNSDQSDFEEILE